MRQPLTFNDLVVEANQLNLYQNLILQLNKDLKLANIDLEFHEDILPTSLKLMLHETIFHLIQQKFTHYLNLLYIIDVSEKEIRELEETDTVKLADEVCLLILKREWQKVYLKNKYK